MQIHYQVFRFTLRAQDNIILPPYKGSTFRGGFGNAFKKIVCALKLTECDRCLLREKCVYAYVFETPPPADTTVMRKYRTVPHPFIIEPPLEKKRIYKVGDEIEFGLILVGKAIDYLPYFIYTFDELGKMGIGKGRGQYELRAVSTSPSSGEGADKAAVIYSSDSKTLGTISRSAFDLNLENREPGGSGRRLTLEFVTPARIIYGKQLVSDIEFHILARQLLRRVALLAYFHCGQDTAGIDFSGLIAKAGDIAVKASKLQWFDWERYSARQDTRMKMGGVIGEITFEGDISAFMPLVDAGEVLHVGKGTAFGLGKYVVSRKH